MVLKVRCRKNFKIPFKHSRKLAETRGKHQPSAPVDAAVPSPAAPLAWEPLPRREGMYLQHQGHSTRFEAVSFCQPVPVLVFFFYRDVGQSIL